MELRFHPALTTTRPRPRGFTLIELLVTIALLAILVSIGVPSFTDTLRAWQRDVATRAFVLHAQMARSEAIKTSRQVIMCTSSDGASCAGNTNWMRGWIVFIDDNVNATPDAGETILATRGPLAGLVRMQTNNNITNFFFLPSGLMPARQGTLVIEPLGGASLQQNAVPITSTGRTSVRKEAKGT